MYGYLNLEKDYGKDFMCRVDLARELGVHDHTVKRWERKARAEGKNIKWGDGWIVCFDIEFVKCAVRNKVGGFKK